MGISLTQPAVLLLFLPLGYLLWSWWHGPVPLSRTRRWLILAVRTVIFLCLVLALAGTELNLTVREQTVVFVVDVSASVGAAREKAEDWIRTALALKSRDDRAAVVVAGKEAQVDRTVARELQFNHLEAVVDPNYSNLAAGLRLAGALLPADTRKRVVLLTDGRENLGDAAQEAALLAAQGARLDVVPLQAGGGPEVLADSLQAPAAAFQGEQVELRVRITSTIKTDADLILYEGRAQISRQRINLHPGANEFAFQVTVNRTGLQTYRAVVTAANDMIQANNEAAAVTHILGSPRALVVAGKEAEGTNLARALQSTGMEAEVRSAATMPQTLAELRQFSSLVLVDVPAAAVGDRVMTAIEAYVRDLGQGLVMIGGENSFGVGGYFRTPVEAALPVNMDLRGKAKVPSLGLVLVIDKSGSMQQGSGGISKVDLAKEAAAQAVEILSAKDSIGVLAFDEESKWVSRTAKLTEPGKVQDAIGTIRADGGTNIYPALEMAYESLLDTDAQLKHIILLTDGMSATGGDYEALVGRMRQAKITLSTVAVGNDADTMLLSLLADWGGGRYYFTNDLPSIPKIFTKETLLATRSYLVNHRFTPYLGAASKITGSLLERGVPPLDGYVATSPKATAQVVLLSDKGDPVLAQWQYGLGRAVAWTSDLGGRWAGAWTGQEFGRFWSELVAWTLPVDTAGTLMIESRLEGGEGQIVVDTAQPFGQLLETGAVILDPELKRTEIDLVPSSPGRYTGRFTAAAPGLYLIEVSQWRNGQPVNGTTAGIVVPYSPEFRLLETDAGFLKNLARTGGGTVIDRPEQAFARNLAPVRGPVGLWRYLLLVTVILLPFDIALRRLVFGPGDIGTWATRIRELGRRRAEPEEPNAALLRLQRRKKQAQQRRATLGQVDGLPLGQADGLPPGQADRLSLGRDDGLPPGQADGLLLGQGDGLSLGRDDGVLPGWDDGPPGAGTSSAARTPGIPGKKETGMAAGSRLSEAREPAGDTGPAGDTADEPQRLSARLLAAKRRSKK